MIHSYIEPTKSVTVIMVRMKQAVPRLQCPVHFVAPRPRPRFGDLVSTPRLRRLVECRTASAGVSDAADEIPSPYDEDDDDSGRVVPSTQHIVVVGAGPTGLLAALYLARRGYNVDVYEREPPPGVHASWRQPNYPMVLSSRALVAFRELKLATSYSGPTAPVQLGTWDVVSGWLEPAKAAEEQQRTAIVDRRGLTTELAAQAEALYSDKIRLHYDCELQELDVAARTATVACTAPTAGSTQYCTADRSRAGVSLTASCTRPPATPSTSSPSSVSSIPSWDTAALEAAGLEGVSGRGRIGYGGSGGEWRQPVCELQQVRFDLLVGADGAESRVRRLMARVKRKGFQKEFEVQVPCVDGEAFKAFGGLPQADACGGSTSSEGSSSSGSGNSSSNSSGGGPAALQGQSTELVPGFGSHSVRQYLYLLHPTTSAVSSGSEAPADAAAVPRLELWVSEPGTVSGIIIAPPGCAWHGPTLRQQLLTSYGAARLPSSWVEAIVAQTCGAGSPEPRSCGRTVQVSQFHVGPSLLLLGDAGHAMTNASRQGLNCAVETVRLLNVVLKISGDSLGRAGSVLSELRGEDAHCCQMMEQMQRGQRPGLVHGDAMFATAGRMSGVIWRAAGLMAALLSQLWPDRFSPTWVSSSLRDNRQGYNEVLKVLTRLAAIPILVLLGVVAYLLRGPVMALIRGF